MFTVVVLYGPPDDPAAFDAHYSGTHVAIASRLPGLVSYTHGRTWELLRMTEMPSVEIVLGYLTNPHDVSVLTSPEHRDQIAEAIVVGVKRLYLTEEDDQPLTGTYSFVELLEAEKDA